MSFPSDAGPDHPEATAFLARDSGSASSTLQESPAMTTRRRALALPFALLLATTALPVAAHHSFNMFNMEKTITVHGVVKDVQWSNPHVILLVTVDPKQPGQPAEWSVECTSPGNLVRMGWSRKSIKPGDKIDVEISPLRDGSAGGAFRKATLLDTGQVFVAAKLSDSEKAEDQ